MRRPFGAGLTGVLLLLFIMENGSFRTFACAKKRGDEETDPYETGG